MARSVSVALTWARPGAWALIWAGPGVAPTSVVIGKSDAELARPGR